jgi:cysteine desulfurase
VDLVAGEFGFGKLARDQHGAAAAIYFFGVAVGLLQAEDEDLLQHLDYVVVSVIVIVQQHHAVHRHELFVLYNVGRGRNGRFRHVPIPPVSAIARRATIVSERMHSPVYLDHHATTPVDPRVLEAMLPYFGPRFGNAASRSHRFGWEAEKAVEQARRGVAALAGATPREIVFTSGATESVNLALKGVMEANRKRGHHLVTVETEHKAVLDTARRLERDGFAVTVLPCGSDGLLDLARLEAALRAETVLVSVMYANNEIGVVQPVRAIGEFCRRRGVWFHCDAAQSFGKIAVNVVEDCIDLLSVSAHKLYGPKGVGALFVRRQGGGVPVAAQMDGGGHEFGFRSGTLNVPGIVGFGEACAIAAVESSGEQEKMRALRDRLWRQLESTLGGIAVNGSMDHRLPGNLNVRFGGIDAEALLTSLPEIALSTGSACSSASVEPSHVLRALGLSPAEARSSVRFGIGRFNTEEEMDYAAARIAAAVKNLRSLSPAAAG